MLVALEEECPKQFNDVNFLSVLEAISNRKSFMLNSVMVPFSSI